MTKQREVAIALPATGEEEWLACKDPILSGWLTQGPKVAEFEHEFATLHDVQHALAVTSCTTGLHLALAGLGIGVGDEVIIPAFTWVATANVVLYCGAVPVFADVDPETFNICPDSISGKITSRTKAVIAVHLFGRCAEMDAIRDVLPKEIAIIEDAACAAGASYNGIFAGGLGDAAAFSFHPRKSITTGEGGMVTTNNAELAETMTRMRNHGASVSEEQRHAGPKPYLMPDFSLLGFNYRMTDVQGAIGLVQLAKLDRLILERQRWATWYREQLDSIPWLRLPEAPTTGRHVWQAYVTYVDPDKSPYPRNEIMQRLQDMGVSTRPGTHAVHLLGYYRDRMQSHNLNLPGAVLCNDNTMAIPLHNRMSEEDYEYVVSCLRAL